MTGSGWPLLMVTSRCLPQGKAAMQIADWAGSSARYSEKRHLFYHPECLPLLRYAFCYKKRTRAAVMYSCFRDKVFSDKDIVINP
jgi:hypothetical protein